MVISQLVSNVQVIGHFGHITVPKQMVIIGHNGQASYMAKQLSVITVMTKII